MVQPNNHQRPPFNPYMWGPPPQWQQPMMPMPPQQQQQPMNVQNQPSNMPNFMQGFLDKDGNFDFNKMLDGANKVHNIINQTQPLIKQLGPLLNFFKK
ncbi:hypothetical protein JOD43_000734 [Pullulanibacillus pueri]|uniref:YppG-like protein n=1 Tax=Pullulanibacillus pueri TaxID=1437324 RepID=A0A8J2ZZM0_9BACL|nr:YppG family protein [Pullulanibacillus pueri]MBM7680572.1 hypothetical protein [Pullulanibacillus pueri]GGH88713.1 hypothetical protein GCM10007096_41670 [Pullulanibacillus pueri]